ncbi:MAG: alpha/beta fold hydrolase [Deltaproteobacteria bacterium]|nr:alpha/beta fold hydrolase [Deltaproteobacteria bacterium]
MEKVTLGDVTIAYETHGTSGSPVLLIMGFTVRGRAWRFQVPALSERHRVATFDHRGVGESDAPPGPYSMRMLAGDALALMDHLGWETAHIVGVSMGGMIAQHIALEHRERVRSVTLLATSAGGFWSRVPRGKGSWYFVKSLLGKGQGRLDAVAKLLFPPSFLAKVDRDWLVEVIRNDFGKRPPANGRRGQLRAVMGHDTRKRLHELEGLPVLVVKPEQDLLIHPKQSERLHRLIPGSRIARLDEAGHGLLRHAEELNDLILDHLAAADAAWEGTGRGARVATPA